MKLSPDQLAQYERDGFLIFPDLLDADEVAILRHEVARVSQIEHESVFREGEVRAPKSMFRLHETDGPTAAPAFHALCRTPRALGVAQQVLGDDALYLHHSKVNVKTAIEGSVWPWHQDYGSWMRDGIQAPDLATFMIALDDATEMNGCLYLLPESHREGRADPYFDESTAYKLWAVPPSRIGMAAIFHPNLMHASGHNLSHTDRWQAYLCYNTVANRPVDVDDPRPDYVRSRNWTPLTPVSDRAIRESAAVTA